MSTHDTPDEHGEIDEIDEVEREHDKRDGPATRWPALASDPRRFRAARDRLRDHQQPLTKSEADALALLLLAADRAARADELPAGVLGGLQLAVVELSGGSPPGTGWNLQRHQSTARARWSGTAGSTEC